MEKRKHDRTEVNVTIDVMVDDEIIPCGIRNLSEGGAFLIVDDESKEKVSSEYIGKKANFVFKSEKQQTLRKHLGEIVRYMENEGEKYLAVAFFD